jgi:amino acid transporter
MAATYPGNGSEVTLSRTLGLLDITMIGVGAMIGAGIFVLTGIAAGEAGPALVLAFLLNGIVTTFTALSYAELGSCFPEAGGGYLWVKEGLGGTQGFLAGWMSWFAHAVACSLYGLGFGRFAVELFILAYPEAEAIARPLTLFFMILVVILFAYINYRGASETGLIGNIVTITKIIILGVFIAFGVRAMLLRPNLDVFTDSFMPNGIGGVFVAMGLTFIAFEGYEIIAQSGEEVRDPKHNIPKAVFLSIFVTVIIYVLVAIVAIGAVSVPAEAAQGNVWDYLAAAREIAVVRAAEQFMGRWGGILILVSGLASTMSALNATIYSSSRVSFAMGRGHNLPEVFSRIHPRLHTPHWAVALSAVLVIAMALSLPIDEVAKAADVMFLFMFAQVNVTLISLRRKRPDLDRGYYVPLFPVPAIIGFVTNVALAVFVAVETGRVGLVSIGWIGGGILLYWLYFRRREEERLVPEIVVHERAPVTAEYTVLVAANTRGQARQLGLLGAQLARATSGEILGLHVLALPRQIPLSDWSLVVEERLPILAELRRQANRVGIPIHTMMRVGRSAAEAIALTATESAPDLLLLSWRTFEEIDGILIRLTNPGAAEPPVDMAILRERPFETLHRILVPVAGGLNCRLGAQLAGRLVTPLDGNGRVVLLYVATTGTDELAIQNRARMAFQTARIGVESPVEERIVVAGDVTSGILEAAAEFDMVVIGATMEPLLRKWRVGGVAQRVVDEANCPVLVVRRHSIPTL